jgi:hypothetical protein
MWRGKIVDAHRMLEQLAAGATAQIAGVGDRRILMRTYFSIACWCTGFPDRALAEMRTAVAIAKDVRDPYTLGLALVNLAAVHLLRRDRHDLIDTTAAAVLANPDFAMWHGPADLLRVWVRSQSTPLTGEEADALITDYRRRLEKFPLGASTLSSRVLGALATSPRRTETHALLDDLFAFPNQRGEQLLLSDLLVWRADLTEDLAVAEPLYRQAIAVARAQGSRSFELRAALFLAKRTHDTGELATILAGFTEGKDTLDQIEARALL